VAGVAREARLSPGDRYAPRMTALDWLLDSDPAIRWQALRDLADAPADVVDRERARVTTEGWGARLLALRGEDGLWEGGALFPVRDGRPYPGTRAEGQPWTATAYSLVMLQDLGVDPSDERIRRTVELVRANGRWEHDGQPFFEGEVEPCINGMVVGLGAFFGEDVSGVVDRLLAEQLDDGGWNCEAENGSIRSSFHTTIRVLEGLLAYEQATGASGRVTEVRRRGEAYLLDRRLLRRLATGELVDPVFLQLAFPTRWHYDVLRGLEHFRLAGDPRDPRLEEAVEVLRSKMRPDGTWLLEHAHRGAVHFAVDDGVGLPSRWNTLRALRVLRWYDRSHAGVADT
jgi:hypothetical protein